VGVAELVEGVGAGGAVGVGCAVDVHVHAAGGDVKGQMMCLGVQG
jgi:hypothetical protein